MIINSANLDALRVGFKTSFQGAFSAVQSQRDRVATTIPSTAGENIYGWLGELSSMQKWLGARAIDNLKSSDYRIKNESWEKTVGVDRNDIEDDTLGQYATRFDMLGRTAARHPEQLVFEALKNGFVTECYDGQYFFDTDHPVIDEDGVTINSVANTDGGSGTPWFLLAASEVIKPIIFQSRKAPNFVNMDRETDGNVFMNRQFIYGVDARYAVGYGFWQMAWGSKQTLDATHYATARAAIYGRKGDHGVPMGLTPNLLVVPPALESAARKLLNSEYAAGGETNEWKGTAELLVVPWLA
jgi:phage major head subunit gpT-like protein